MKTTRFLVFLSLVLLCVTVARADTLRTVALSGDVAPGTDVSFLTLGWPALNNAGQTAFSSSLTGPEVNDTNDRGMWSEGSGPLVLTAREGSAAPGTGEAFLAIGGPVLNNAGQIAFPGLLTDNRARGVWSEGRGSLALVAREGNAAPDTSGVFYNFEFPVILNDLGQTAFAGRLAHTGVNNVNDGIWSEGGGSLALLAREGNIAPGTNGSFGGFGFPNRPVINDAGQIAFMGDLTGTGVNYDSGIWVERGGSLAMIAQTGGAAPGTGGSFLSLGVPPVLNNAGQTAFTAFFVGPGVTDGYDSGIWAERNGSLDLVVREGDDAPGTGEVFSSLFVPIINRPGHVAFTGFVTGSGVTEYNNSGVWSEGRGSLHLVAREGSEAPGTNDVFSWFSTTSRSVLNSRGQIAFLASLTGSGVNSNNDHGIWAEDPLGRLTLIAREGDLLDVDDGPGTDFRTIADLGFEGNTGNEDGRASGFNDVGQLAFRATFTDGTSGIFVSNLVAVPEPGSLLLVLLAAVAVLLPRRRR